MKQPVVLCMIEGFGISSLWKGNAIASANPEHFYELWNTYQHKLLSPLKNENEPIFNDAETYLSTILSGSNQPWHREIIDHEIKTDSFSDNEVVNASFGQVLQSNSALHLIGNLSNKQGEFGDMDHLISLIKLAKQKNIFRIFIHLFIDSSVGDNFSHTASMVSDLNQKISSIGAGEIATICGAKFLEDKNNKPSGSNNYSKVLQAMIEGRGNNYLSAEQVISHNNSKVLSPDQITPSVIFYKNRPLGTIHDLDSVIFFNHNNATLSNLISFLCSTSTQINFKSTPKFLNVSVFFDFVLPRNDKINIIFKKILPFNISSILAQNKYSQVYISDSHRLLQIKSCLADDTSQNLDEIFVPALNLSEYCRDPKTVILKEMSHTVDCLTVDKDFIFLDIPSIDVIAREGTFEQTIKAVQIIDRCLPLLTEKVLNCGGTLIITSNYGNAEKMIHRNPYETLNHRSNNPVPFIIISPETKHATLGRTIENELMCDIIQKRRYICDIAPTILDLFKLPATKEMIGKSLLK